MRRSRISGATALAFGSFILVAAPAAAQNVAGDELRALVTDKRVLLATQYGVEFPLTYRSDGTVTGDGSGLGLAKFFVPRETGQWWVDGSQLCQQFPTWYDGEVSCFTIEQTSKTTLNWTRDDGESGTARIEG